jgi:hypothetical protein
MYFYSCLVFYTIAGLFLKNKYEKRYVNSFQNHIPFALFPNLNLHVQAFILYKDCAAVIKANL